MNLASGLSHAVVALRALPFADRRHLLRVAWQIERALPSLFARYPLAQLMEHLDAEAAVIQTRVSAPTATELADTAAVLDYFSPLGICLRRSLVRYVVLRGVGVPLVVQFGAKKNSTTHGGRIAGHAWLTCDGLPYAENPRDYQGFTPIYVYPSDNSSNPNSCATTLDATADAVANAHVKSAI
jgi:hypothetical protein